MKKIEAIIKPFKLDEVKEALQEVGVQGITVTEVKALAARRAIPTLPGRRIRVDFLPKVKIEIVVPDDPAGAPSIEAIENAAQHRPHRRRQDFRPQVEEVIRIRTGETGPGSNLSPRRSPERRESESKSGRTAPGCV